MARRNNTILWPFSPDPPSLLAAIFDCLSDNRLLAELWLIRANSRPGYPLRALWRAYVASFVLNLGSTNDLIRRLHADKGLRKVCGFGDILPHRTTFNRFITRAVPPCRPGRGGLCGRHQQAPGRASRAGG